MAKKQKPDTVVIGHFQYLDDALATVRKLREEKFETVEVFSPFPNHDLEDEVYHGKPRSPVRMFTLLGATIGCLGAFLMTIWMSMDYPMRTSAKTVVSIPAFVVIAFECTILLGGLFTLLSMFHFSRIPNLSFFQNYRPNFSEDTFGITVRVGKEQADGLKKDFEALGARLVEVQYVR